MPLKLNKQFFNIIFSNLLLMIGAGEYAPIPPVFGPFSFSRKKIVILSCTKLCKAFYVLNKMNSIKNNSKQQNQYKKAEDLKSFLQKFVLKFQQLSFYFYKLQLLYLLLSNLPITTTGKLNFWSR